MQVRWNGRHSVKAISAALAGAVAVAAVAGVWQAASPASAAAVPVTAPGFAGSIGTIVPASTVLATIDNSSGTALTAGSAITIHFPAGTTLNAASINGVDFIVQQAGSCAGNAAGTPASPGASATGTILTLSVAGNSLSAGGSCAGKGLITISTSSSINVGGNDITRPATAGTYTVAVSTANDSGATDVVISPGVSSTGIVPDKGPITGGTPFTLTGTGFVAPTTIMFGTAAATDVVVVSPTTITGKTPSVATVGVVTVSVSNANGQTAILSYNYTAAGPAAITVPAAPTDVRATGGDGWAVVSWTAPASNGGSALTGYVVTCNPGGHTVTVLPSTTSTIVYGLTNGEAYLCSVAAKNAIGSSTSAAATGVVVPLAGAAPVATPGPNAPPAPGQSNTSAQTVDVNGDRWVRGINGVVMSGGGDIGAFVALIESESGFDVLAVWVPVEGLYEFYLPQTPGVSTLRTLPGLVIATLGVLV